MEACEKLWITIMILLNFRFNARYDTIESYLGAPLTENCPAMLRRGPEAGDPYSYYNFSRKDIKSEKHSNLENPVTWFDTGFETSLIHWGMPPCPRKGRLRGRPG
jgi:hypothetical protein